MRGEDPGWGDPARLQASGGGWCGAAGVHAGWVCVWAEKGLNAMEAAPWGRGGSVWVWKGAWLGACACGGGKVRGALLGGGPSVVSICGARSSARIRGEPS